MVVVVLLQPAVFIVSDTILVMLLCPFAQLQTERPLNKYLKAYLRTHNLSARGNKAALIKRIEAWYRGQ